MIILPTRGRPRSISRFAEHYVKTAASEPVKLVIDHDDSSYEGLSLPPQFSFKVMPPHNGISECVNSIFTDHPNLEYYGIMADDIVPETPHWDTILKEACLKYGIAWGDDTMPRIHLPTHPFVSGKLVRHIGWLTYTKTKHWYVDNVFKDIADIIGGKLLTQVKTPHHHILNSKADLDETYMNQPSREKDKAAYLHFCEHELPALREHLKSFTP